MVISPSAGETFLNPPEIHIAAQAEDADGYVQAAELLTELGSLGVITPNPASALPVNPFQWTWTNPPAGEHKLVVKVTDNGGAVTESSAALIVVKRDPATSPATLTFVKPPAGATLPWSDPVSIELTAVDPNGDIRHVEFFANGVPIGRSDHWTKDAVIPGKPREHFLEWKPAREGFYRLSARATDSLGLVVESKPISVTIGVSLPIVSIEASQPETREPAANIRVRPGVFTIKRSGAAVTPLTVYLRYEGSATPGVDYQKLPETVTFAAGQSVIELLVAPLEDSVAESAETVAAILYDPGFDRLPDQIIDPQKQAAKVLIYDSPPSSGASLTITSPRDGQVIPPGEPVKITATAIDPAGYIARVEFYDFEKLIGVSQITFIRAPDPGTPIYHAYEWQNPPAGEHQLTARAVDSKGNPVISNPVHIKVGNASGVALLEITSPPDGQVFAEGEAVEIRAIAIDPAGYIPRVEFYDAGKLIGVSQIYFIRPPDPGTPIYHSYTWKNPPAGEHWLSARAVDSKGNPIASKSVRIQVGGASPWPVVEIFAVDPEATEFSALVDAIDPARFSITRTGDLSQELWVAFTLHGTATPEKDFQRPEQKVRIPPGQAEVIVPIVPVSDEAPEPMETVVLQLEDPLPISSMRMLPYEMTAEHRSALAVIYDRKRPERGELAFALPDAGQIYPRSHPIPLTVAAYHPTADLRHVDFFANGKQIGSSDVSSANANPGGLKVHRFDWKDPLPGEQILTARAIVADGSVLEAPKLVVTVKDATKTVTVLSPQAGAVFTVGEPISIKAAAGGGSVFSGKLELWLDEALMASSERPELALTRSDVAPGAHVLVAARVDSAGSLRSAPVKFLVREVDAVAFVQRQLPAGYVPGKSLTVTLTAKPPVGTSAYALEDQPPLGWTVGDISHEGFFDASTGRVKFGLFSDNQARTLTYHVTAPATAQGRFEFSGNSSMDGKLLPIGGDRVVAFSSDVHPADRSPRDHAVTLAELTAYGAAWKKGESWETGPVPISLSYVTKAGQLWKHGEKYSYDPAAGAPPACWKSATRVAGLGFVPAIPEAAVRAIAWTDFPESSVTVQIQVTPGLGSNAYAVQEQLPVGWIPSEVGQEGYYDAQANCIRWGVFLDGEARSLTYRATVAAFSTGAPRGAVSFDGSVAAVRGLSTVAPGEGAGALAQFKHIERRADGSVQLRLTGPTDHVCTVEVSSDLVHWTELTPILLSDGEIGFEDVSENSQIQRFYRTR